jgi:hypothetical protein
MAVVRRYLSIRTVFSIGTITIASITNTSNKLFNYCVSSEMDYQQKRSSSSTADNHDVIHNNNNNDNDKTQMKSNNYRKRSIQSTLSFGKGNQPSIIKPNLIPTPLMVSPMDSTSSIDPPPFPYRFYIDLDGVLVDFVSGVRNYCHLPQYHDTDIELIPPRVLFTAIGQVSHFYENLSWTVDGELLWQTLRPYRPSILSGVPLAPYSARIDKFRWCQRELCMECVHIDMAGPKSQHCRVYSAASSSRNNKNKSHLSSSTTTNQLEQQAAASLSSSSSAAAAAAAIISVITCWSKNKHCESGRNRILIDDRLKLRDAWVAKGGIFIHHQSTQQTLDELRQLGILPTIDKE